jgi:uncharacterized protein (DUF1501 family)
MPNRKICCDDFTRTEMLRAGAAGLSRSNREWDPRMPTPAGTGMDRRRFLIRSAQAAGALLSVYGAERVGLGPSALHEGIAEAAAVQGPNSPILLSVFIPGGMDGLSFLAPVNDPTYRKLRPKLALSPHAGTVFSEDPRLHWHPAARSFDTLHQAGKVTVFPGIGYTHPDMSHFTSRHYWEVGALETRLTTGWLGRYLDVVGSNNNPLQGLSLDGEMMPTIASGRKPVAAIDRPENFSVWVPGVWGDVYDLSLDAMSSLGDALKPTHDAAIKQVASVASEIGVMRRQLAQFRDSNGNPTYKSPVKYPDSSDSDFPQVLAGLAAMIAAKLPLRCVAVTAPGEFDTHSDQPQAFSQGLQLAADSLAAFQADIEKRGLADRVLIHVWTEFGRRPEENGSDGTDHGAGGVSMLIGTRTSGKMVGEWPGLAKLDPDGNLRSNVDFRGVYASLLEQWFNFDSAAVIPGAKGLPRYRLVQ